MSLIKRLNSLYWKHFKSPVEYARHLGVKVGDNTFIAIREWSTEPYLIEIGNNVYITKGVMLHTHGGSSVARRFYPLFDCFGRIIIKDWVYIGAGAQIMPGVTIGEGSLVAAGSIVTKSVDPFSVVAGNPAKVLCKVDEYIDRNLKYNLNSKNLTLDEKKALLLSLSDDMFIKK